MKRPHIICLHSFLTLALATGIFSAPALAADSAAPASPADVAEVTQLLERLDSPRYAEREEATRLLREQALAASEDSEFLQTLGQQVFDESLSLDRQLRFVEILGGVSIAEVNSPQLLTAADVEVLIDNLVAEKFSVRLAATRRLGNVLNEQRNIVPVWLALKARLEDPRTPLPSKTELAPFCHFLRKRWLEAAEENCILPPVEDDQILSWVQTVARPNGNKQQFAEQQVATQELQDLLARTECLPKTKQALEAELSRTADSECAQRLKELLDLIPPAMVAEIWAPAQPDPFGIGFSAPDREIPIFHLSTLQYLQVGLPQLPDGCSKVTHFDFCNDEKAYCVSGNSLSSGEYPVRAAILHWGFNNPMIFQFVNLPTPRRRLHYEYSLQRPEAIQRLELSTNTCEALLSGRKKFSEADSRLLCMLDANAISSFAGEYLAKIKDYRLDGRGDQISVGLPSAHGGLCYALATIGTKAAAPGIISALATDRILPPDFSCTYDLPRIALLAIAVRDPWKEVDRWLLEQLDRGLPLVSNVDPAPELAATAAAILCKRHQLHPHSFDLVAVEDMFCESVGLQLYRFADTADPVAIKKAILNHLGETPRVPAG